MPIGMVFWMIFILWFLLWGWGNWYGGPAWGHWFMIAAMFFLLGWKDFGFVIH